jgi:predicted secreted hydrolase
MKLAHLTLVVAIVVSAAVSNAIANSYRLAVPGYHYEFPRDHFNHPDFQTEWWYYTGNLMTSDGRRFGFELTFFRQGVKRNTDAASHWEIEDLYMAHLALSDLAARRFLHRERLNRAGPGLAGADLAQARIWNGNWQVRWSDKTQHLQAIADQFALELDLKSLKPPVINGRNGVSQKAAGSGRASHYVSLTRLDTTGAVMLDGREYRVQGSSWMDHEFFTNQLDPSETGWDWFAIQLEDGAELMLYRLRRRDGSVDPYSAGTFVDPTGRSLFLSANDFTLLPGESWKSPHDGAVYPVRWQVRVPSRDLDLEVKTLLPDQELTGSNQFSANYWEGAIDVTGHSTAGEVKGVGYLEMTGYDRPFMLPH